MQSNKTEKPVVVVTGSSGLIGSRLITKLCDQYQVAGLDIAPPKRKIPGTTFAKCDMTEDESVGAALHQVADDFGNSIASVIHLAAYYDFSGEPSPMYQELTVDGTRRLLKHLQAFDVKQFVFSSTLLAMKPSDDGQPVNAFSSTAAEWDYPQSKLAAEAVIQEERQAIHTVILRLAGVYDEDCNSLPVAQQISRIYEKQLESYFFPGDASHGQAFIHLDDLVECVLHVIKHRTDLSAHELFVIGEEDVMSYEELQEKIGVLVHGKEWPSIRIPKAAAKAGAWVKDKLASDEDSSPFIKPWMIDLADQNYPVSLHRAKNFLEWKPEHTLRGTLPEIVDRLHRDPKRWYELNGLPVPDMVEEHATSGAEKS